MVNTHTYIYTPCGLVLAIGRAALSAEACLRSSGAVEDAVVAANGSSAACNPRSEPPHTQDDERCLACLDGGMVAPSLVTQPYF